MRHRVDEILQLSEKHDWKHCPGEENVADIGSHGIGALQLSQSDVWLHGPKCLSKGEDAWPLHESAIHRRHTQQKVRLKKRKQLSSCLAKRVRSKVSPS